MDCLAIILPAHLDRTQDCPQKGTPMSNIRNIGSATGARGFLIVLKPTHTADHAALRDTQCVAVRKDSSLAKPRRLGNRCLHNCSNVLLSQPGCSDPTFVLLRISLLNAEIQNNRNKHRCSCWMLRGGKLRGHQTCSGRLYFWITFQLHTSHSNRQLLEAVPIGDRCSAEVLLVLWEGSQSLCRMGYLDGLGVR